MFNNPHIFLLPKNEIRLRFNDPMLKKCPLATMCLFPELITQNFSISANHENETLSLSCCMPKRFHWIGVVEASKSKFIYRHSESKNI